MFLIKSLKSLFSWSDFKISRWKIFCLTCSNAFSIIQIKIQIRSKELRIFSIFFVWNEKSFFYFSQKKFSRKAKVFLRKRCKIRLFCKNINHFKPWGIFEEWDLKKKHDCKLHCFCDFFSKIWKKIFLLRDSFFSAIQSLYIMKCSENKFSLEKRSFSEEKEKKL